MAVIELSSARPVFAASSVVAKPFYAAATAVADWNNARITRNALSRLTARELDDIGLIPGDIEMIAKR